MCVTCSKKHTQGKFFCTYCNTQFGCINSGGRMASHLKDGSCTIMQCTVHGFHNEGYGNHYQTCKLCQSTYDCDKLCPNNCCSQCSASGYVLCHCNGNCGQPGCKCLKSTEYSQPQHKLATLTLFGVTTKGQQPPDLVADGREFYGAIAMWDGPHNKEQSKVVYEVAERLAKKFINAIICATAGEFRSVADHGANATAHFIQEAYPKYEARMKKRGKKPMPIQEYKFYFDGYYMMSRPRGMGNYIRRLHAGMYAKTDGDEGDYDSSERSVRTRSAATYKQAVIDKYGPIVALRHCVNFWNMQGGGGVGGVKWARCAWVGLQYLQGNMSAIEFVDSAFNLQHNNAILFTKTHRLEPRHKQFLDMRRQAEPEWIIRRSPPELRKRMGYDLPPVSTIKKITHTGAKELVTA